MQMSMADEKRPMPRETFPEGWRKCVIEDVEVQTSSKGNEMFVVILRDVETACCDTIYLMTEQGKRWALKKLLLSCGVKIEDHEVYNFEIADLLDKQVEAKNKLIDEEFTDRKGEAKMVKKNKISDFRESINF